MASFSRSDLLRHCAFGKISRSRRSLGWIYTGKCYAQLIRHVNRPLRHVFCLHSLAVGDRFENVIFSDESSVPLGTSLNKCFRKRGQLRTLVGKPKHPLKVHVWGGISARGATKLCIFRGIMDAEFYREILQTHLLPFIRTVYSDGHRFQQDNDPKHVSRDTVAWMLNNGMNYWPTPAESPDLNPIENIWAALKRHVYKVAKPTTQDQLTEAIHQYWGTLTPQICRRYIDHLHKVMPVVIAREGAASGM